MQPVQGNLAKNPPPPLHGTLTYVRGLKRTEANMALCVALRFAPSAHTMGKDNGRGVGGVGGGSKKGPSCSKACYGKVTVYTQ